MPVSIGKKDKMTKEKPSFKRAYFAYNSVILPVLELISIIDVFLTSFSSSPTSIKIKFHFLVL
jgi:hypothetical protein